MAALRYPGDADDDPTKVAAPSRVYDLAGIEALAAHTQFLLMNTHKSGDWYGAFTGVPMEDLLTDAGMLASATGIQVYAPDGFATYHPLDPTTGFYHVRGAVSAERLLLRRGGRRGPDVVRLVRLQQPLVHRASERRPDRQRGRRRDAARLQARR